jgi:hypothetical protein
MAHDEPHGGQHNADFYIFACCSHVWNFSMGRTNFLRLRFGILGTKISVKQRNCPDSIDLLSRIRTPAEANEIIRQPATVLD